MRGQQGRPPRPGSPGRCLIQPELLRRAGQWPGAGSGGQPGPGGLGESPEGGNRAHGGTAGRELGEPEGGEPLPGAATTQCATCSAAWDIRNWLSCHSGRWESGSGCCPGPSPSKGTKGGSFPPCHLLGWPATLARLGLWLSVIRWPLPGSSRLLQRHQTLGQGSPCAA